MPTGAAYARRRKRGRGFVALRTAYRNIVVPAKVAGVRSTRMSTSAWTRGRNPIYRFRETTSMAGGGIIQNTCGAGPAPGETRGSLVFSLDQISYYASYQTLFDEYRITWVNVRFTALANVNMIQAANGVFTNPFWTAIDFNDNSSGTPVLDLKLYSNAKAHDITKSFNVFFRPKVLQMIYQSAIATSYQASRPGWIATADAAVPHYCLKYGCEGIAQAPGTIDLFRVDITYGLEFRSQK